MRAKLQKLNEELRRRINGPIPETGKWLTCVVSGYFAYHAGPIEITSPPSGIGTILAAASGRMRSGPETGRRISPRAASFSSLAKRALRRQAPEAGAVCGNSARTDLSGGRQ
jgi:hypothetical protein